MAICGMHVLDSRQSSCQVVWVSERLVLMLVILRSVPCFTAEESWVNPDDNRCLTELKSSMWILTMHWKGVVKPSQTLAMQTECCINPLVRDAVRTGDVIFAFEIYLDFNLESPLCWTRSLRLHFFTSDRGDKVSGPRNYMCRHFIAPD